MKDKRKTQATRLIMDVVVVLAVIVFCFLYLEHSNQIQNEANTILMNSLEDLNNSLANTASPSN
ncbi:hypothetical protein ACFQZJ_19355 [Maribacter chungangensis]|uniref:Uncharacterized protein n=1 Tax=Maribacter chungangensis TaxID=1069117 RepID=A0ABW3B8Z9_9FLAO